MGPSLAIATAFVHGDDEFNAAGCGLVKWCHSAAGLSSLPYLAGDSEIMVLTDSVDFVRAECGRPARIVTNGRRITQQPLKVVFKSPKLVQCKPQEREDDS